MFQSLDERLGTLYEDQSFETITTSALSTTAFAALLCCVVGIFLFIHHRCRLFSTVDDTQHLRSNIEAVRVEIQDLRNVTLAEVQYARTLISQDRVDSEEHNKLTNLQLSSSTHTLFAGVNASTL